MWIVADRARGFLDRWYVMVKYGVVVTVCAEGLQGGRAIVLG